MEIVIKETGVVVSTHSRAKAAAFNYSTIRLSNRIRFNTQPREGGC